jgi:PAS domain S-box-containing protein
MFADPNESRVARSPAIVAALGFASVIVISIVDYITDPQIGLSPFYLIPVLICTWYGGWWVGNFLSLLSASCWLIDEWLWSTPYSHPFIPYLNAAIRLATFFFCTFLLHRFKDLNANLEARVEARTRALNEEIGERKRAEEALSEQWAFLRKVIDLNPGFIFAKDREGRFTLANQSVADAYGTTVDGILGKRDADFNPDMAEVEHFRKMDLQVMDAKEIRFIPEEKITDAHGKVRWLQTMKIPIVDDHGGANQVLGVSSDITERKALEHRLTQAQKMESIGTLAGGIAHDFNNILGIILGYAAMLDGPQVDPNAISKNSEAIVQAARRGSGLVRQLLAFARKSESRFEVMQINNVVQEIVKLIGETFPRVIEVTPELEPNLPKITADYNQIHQVLLNLCVNARDAMPSGGKLTVRTALVPGISLRTSFPKSVQLHYVLVTIADTGAGMDPATVQRIFEPFFTTKDIGKGTGLGLSMVYGIVENHNGFIDVESHQGKGSEFHVYLPVIPAVVAGQ